MPIPGNMLSSVAEMVDPNTSGWTAMLNATLGLGTGGRNGDGCLAVKSIAAGEMRARTVSSYPVVAGTVYQTLADASGATVPERIGIRWLTAAGTEISITWSLTTAAASSSWHRISVAGPAPATAARAQVVVSSTPAAALVTTFIENVYLGLPLRTSGNMLSFASESPEVDTSTWAVEVNGTIGRSAPAVGWAYDFWAAGGHMWTLTATAAGNASARAVERPAVAPGTEYMASCYLSPPTAGASTWVELRYYTAAGAQISATRATLAAPGTGTYRQRVAAPAPSNAATCGIAVGITGATAGQVTRFEAATIGPAITLVAGNILPYADGGFEQGVGSWTTVSGAAVLARSTPWGAASEGNYSMTITAATAGTSVIRSARYPMRVVGAHRLRYVIQNAVNTWSVGVAIRWYSAAGVDLGTTGWVPVAIPTAAGWWGYVLSGDPPPAGATEAAAEFTVVSTGTSSVMRLDNVALWQALPIIETTATESTGSMTLTIRDLVPGDFLRVYRVLQDGARTFVRGPAGLWDGTRTVDADTVRIEDYEVPLAVPVGYRVEVIDAVTGVSRWRETLPLTLPWPDINRAWLSDPGNPQRNLIVTVAAQPSWTRPIEQAEYVVKGRRNKVILSGTRQGREGEVQVYTESDAERERLDWLLDSGNVLLWRTGPGVGVGNQYMNVGATSESREGQPAQDTGRVWTLPVVEADMPVTTGVNGSGNRTWQDILSEFATWQAVLDAFETWEDVLLNRRKA
ncbi:hypothetical protein ABT081_02345 [Streptomyces sp. NPDC002238]|uniref:hypothetical protein n=1 Tax=Streptomyces sp. NPDC002238 TaxID=3156649 RepID=UPI0033174105